MPDDPAKQARILRSRVRDVAFEHGAAGETLDELVGLIDTAALPAEPEARDAEIISLTRQILKRRPDLSRAGRRSGLTRPYGTGPKANWRPKVGRN